MNFRWLVILVFLIGSVNQAQEIYYVTEDNEFFRLNLEDYSSESLLDIQTTGIGTVVDIAFDTQGNLFAITNFDLILQIDFANQSYEIFYSVTVPGNFPGLVSNAQNELFFGAWFSERLYKFNPGDQTVVELAQGVPTPGDFTFYKGNLLFPNANDDALGSFNGSNIQYVGCAQGPLYSLVNVFNDCDDNDVYGIDDQNHLYRYDIETNSQELLVQIDAPGTIYGAATMSEAFASDCPLIALDDVNCSLGVETVEENAIKIYPNPTVSEIFFETQTLQISELVLFDINGKQLLKQDKVTTGMSLMNLEAGVYFIEVFVQGRPKPYIKKVIKK